MSPSTPLPFADTNNVFVCAGIEAKSETISIIVSFDEHCSTFIAPLTPLYATMGNL